MCSTSLADGSRKLSDLISKEEITMIRALRSVSGVFAGLMLISVIAEGIEFLLVALVHGSITTDQDVY